MIFVMLGAPGSGKGTQADMLVETTDAIKLSTGEMMRREVAQNTALGKQVAQFVTSGRLVSDDVIFAVLKQSLLSLPGQSKIVLDGFPRTLQQAQMLAPFLEENGRSIGAVFYFKIRDEVVVERLSGRYQCDSCQATYHDQILSMEAQGTCQKCKDGQLFRRNDDAPEVIMKRLQVFHTETKPLVEFYETQGLVKVLDAEQPKEVIADQIALIIAPLFA